MTVNQLWLHLGLQEYTKESYNIFLLFLYSKQRQEECSEVKDNNNNYHTKYLFFPLNFLLFNIFSTLYSFSSSIITSASCFFSGPLLDFCTFVLY